MGSERGAMDPLEADLREHSVTGSPSPMFVLSLLVGSGILFVTFGIYVLVDFRAIGGAVFAFLVGGFNIVLGMYGAMVTKAAGAVWIRIDDQGMILRFPNQTETREDWSHIQHAFEVLWTDPGVPDLTRRYGEVRLFWKPRTRMPVAFAQQIVEYAKARGLKIRSTTGTDRRRRPILRNTIS